MAVSNTRKFINLSKAIFFLAASVLILICSYMFVTGSGASNWYKNIRAEVTNQPYARTVTVNAEGKITAKPDIAYVSLSVATAGQSVSAVTSRGNQQMNQVIEAVKKLGVEDQDIKTTNYNLFPRYNDRRSQPIIQGEESEENQTPKIVGYTLNQTVEVKIRDLQSVDEILNAGLAAGANQVGALRFDIDEASELKKEAREMAFDKAREKAEQMASAAGVNLGRVVTFNEGFDAGPRPYANFAYDREESVSAVQGASIEAGSQDLTINVAVTYEIE
ncbi:DUF541 domain-containing protein [Candidatus Peregrinibacteria bacterium]|nr:DUF541 domain-containing protein [Candidatus Peregrinibacteria bacterium]